MLVWEYALAIPPNVFNKTDTNLKTINQYAKELVLIKYMPFNSELSEVKIIFSEATPLYMEPSTDITIVILKIMKMSFLSHHAFHKFYWVLHYMPVIVLY